MPSPSRQPAAPSPFSEDFTRFYTSDGTFRYLGHDFDIKHHSVQNQQGFTLTLSKPPLAVSGTKVGVPPSDAFHGRHYHVCLQSIATSQAQDIQSDSVPHIYLLSVCYLASALLAMGFEAVDARPLGALHYGTSQTASKQNKAMSQLYHSASAAVEMCETYSHIRRHASTKASNNPYWTMDRLIRLMVQSLNTEKLDEHGRVHALHVNRGNSILDAVQHQHEFRQYMPANHASKAPRRLLLTAKVKFVQQRASSRPGFSTSIENIELAGPPYLDRKEDFMKAVVHMTSALKDWGSQTVSFTDFRVTGPKQRQEWMSQTVPSLLQSMRGTTEGHNFFDEVENDFGAHRG